MNRKGVGRSLACGRRDFSFGFGTGCEDASAESGWRFRLAMVVIGLVYRRVDQLVWIEAPEWHPLNAENETS